jgi:methylphosphotriester-DNA--protein-cysteine methyltransferase
LGAILQELVYDSLADGAVWPFDDRYIRPPHFHGQLECLLILRGSARLHLGAGGETVRARHLCWILPSVPHVMSGFSPDFDMWVMQLDPALVAACWRALDPGASSTPAGLFERWPILLGERLAGRAVVELAAEQARRLGELAAGVWGAGSAAAARPSLRTLLDLALRATLPNIDDRRPVSVSQLASCVLLASPMMDRPALAAELGVSQGFLSRRFQREMGVTLVEHRTRTRIAHFLALAQSTGSNLLNAALDAGFGSYSQFHRAFSRVSGSRPRDYLSGGRQSRQLWVAGDPDEPQTGPMLALPARQRQRARLDAS